MNLDDIEAVEKAFKENEKITGHITQLDDERLVFLGESPERKDAIHVAFRNSEGQDTRLWLSKEAMDALVKLYKTPFKGQRTTFPMIIRKAFVVTISTTEEGYDPPASAAGGIQSEGPNEQ